MIVTTSSDFHHRIHGNSRHSNFRWHDSGFGLKPLSRGSKAKVVCKLNDCILGRKSSVRQRRQVPVAKRVRLLTLLNCSLATCFAAGVHINLQLLEVSLKFFFNKPSYLLIYSYTVSALSQVSANRSTAAWCNAQHQAYPEYDYYHLRQECQ